MRATALILNAIACLLSPPSGFAASTTFTTITSQDVFVATGSADNPNLGGDGKDHDLTDWNFGDSGTLVICSAGYSYYDPSAGRQLSKGAFQSVIRFDLGGAGALFDATYGAGRWQITSITLQLSSNWGTEGAIPNNPSFSAIHGGNFAIEWLASDNWQEGTGNPSFPTTDGLTYSDLGALVGGGHEMLGIYTYVPPGQVYSDSTQSLVDAPVYWSLPLTENVLADAMTGGDLSLLFYAADDQINYLFNSRRKTDREPLIHIEAIGVPEPATIFLAAAGLLGIGAAWPLSRDGTRPRKAFPTRRSAGFTLPELLAVLAILLIVATLGYGALTHSIERANTAKCLGNLRQWGMALQSYIADHDGCLPRRGQGVQQVWIIDRAEDWFNALPPYFDMPTYHELSRNGRVPKPGAQSIFVCPSATAQKGQKQFLTYGMNMYLSRWDQRKPTRITQIPNPGTLAFLADSPGGYASTIPSANGYSVKARHLGCANIVFVDGHAATFDGKYLGCGSAEKTQPDVRWKTNIGIDSWKPNL